MQFITITRAYDEKVIVHHRSIEEVIDWAKSNNFTYKEEDKDVTMGIPRFTVKRADHGPLTKEAIEALRQCKWQGSEWIPDEYEGIGLDHRETAKTLRRPRA